VTALVLVGLLGGIAGAMAVLGLAAYALGRWLGGDIR